MNAPIQQRGHPGEEPDDLQNLMESSPETVEHVVRVAFQTVDAAIEQYVDKRDSLRLLKKLHEKEETSLDEELDAIAMWLREKADEIGVDSFKTAHGTAYRSLKESYRAVDWESFVGWMKETGNFQCVEKRPAKNAVREIHRDNLQRVKQLKDSGASQEDIDKAMLEAVPPGLDYLTEVEFNVLRPKKGKGDE